jgi:hypothetical protein
MYAICMRYIHPQLNAYRCIQSRVDGEIQSLYYNALFLIFSELIALQPVIPGHEIVGHVVRVGSKVTEFKVGDRAGVG